MGYWREWKVERQARREKRAAMSIKKYREALDGVIGHPPFQAPPARSEWRRESSEEPIPGCLNHPTRRSEWRRGFGETLCGECYDFRALLDENLRWIPEPEPPRPIQECPGCFRMQVIPDDDYLCKRCRKNDNKRKV